MFVPCPLPSLLVRNNSEANINVGEQVPGAVDLASPAPRTGLIGSFQYINTGVILSVTPRVNPGGLVYLQVDQEVSSPVTGPDEANPPVDTRRVSTEVAVQSGQTVMLGGLIRETESNRIVMACRASAAFLVWAPFSVVAVSTADALKHSC
jgi:general secretion pathway protein D